MQDLAGSVTEIEDVLERPPVQVVETMSPTLLRELASRGYRLQAMATVARAR